MKLIFVCTYNSGRGQMAEVFDGSLKKTLAERSARRNLILHQADEIPEWVNF